MTQASKINFHPEWSSPLEVADIEDKPLSITISPSEEERNRLARRLDLLSLDQLEATVTLQRIQGSATLYVEGRLKADVTQECVVTGDPVQSHIEESFEAWYAEENATVSLTKARKEKMLAKGNTELPMTEEKDDPEPVIDGTIDLGELVTQYLSLSINPYPHAEGVVYENGDDTAQNEPFSFKNPFAGLKDWKDKLTGKE